MKTLVLRVAVAVLALSGIAALPLALADIRQERSDCPGKVVCPLTGEEVCKDRCPLAAKQTGATRADCPGQVECPLTGELACRDQCPATNAAKPAETEEALAAGAESDLAPCCRNLKK